MEAINQQKYEEERFAVCSLISSASITKLAKNENLNTEKICKALDCDIADIVEMVKTYEV